MKSIGSVLVCVFSLQLVIIFYEWIWVNLDKGCYHWSFILAPISSASLSKTKTENIFIHILPVTQNLKGLLLWSQSMSNSKQLCLNFKKMKYKVLHCEWDQSHRCRKEEVLFGKKTHKTIFIFQLTMSLLGCGFNQSHCILDFSPGWSAQTYSIFLPKLWTGQGLEELFTFCPFTVLIEFLG